MTCLFNRTFSFDIFTRLVRELPWGLGVTPAVPECWNEKELR